MKKLILGIVALIIVAGAFIAGKMFSNDIEKALNPVAFNTGSGLETVEYHEMDRFIISVSDGDNARYLVLDLVLAMPSGVENRLDAELITPLLRNVLVRQFANMTHPEVKELFENIDGVQKTLTEEFNKVLAGKTPLRLDNVLVTNVFIQ